MIAKEILESLDDHTEDSSIAVDRDSQSVPNIEENDESFFAWNESHKSLINRKQGLKMNESSTTEVGVQTSLDGSVLETLPANCSRHNDHQPKMFVVKPSVTEADRLGQFGQKGEVILLQNFDDNGAYWYSRCCSDGSLTNCRTCNKATDNHNDNHSHLIACTGGADEIKLADSPESDENECLNEEVSIKDVISSIREDIKN